MRQVLTRAIKNSELAWTGIAQVLLVIQSVVQVKLLTTYLSKTDYGEWALVLSICLLVGMLPFSAFDQGVSRLAGSLRTAADQADLIKRVTVAYTGIFGCWIACFVGVATITDHREALPGILVFTFTEVIKGAVISFNNAVRKRRRVASQRAWEAVAKSAFLWLAAMLGPLNVDVVLSVFSCVNVVTIAISWRTFSSRQASTTSSLTFRTTARDVVRFSWPLLIWALFNWLQPMVSRWYLADFVNAGAVASYAVVVSTSVFIPNFAYSVVATYLLPVLFSRAEALPLRSYVYVLGAFAVGLAIYTLATIPGSAHLLTVLTDRKYVGLADYVPWVSASASLYAVASLSAADMFRAGRTKALLIPTIAPGLLSAVIGLLLVPTYGLLGAVLTFIAGQCVYTLATTWVSTRHLMAAQRRGEPG